MGAYAPIEVGVEAYIVRDGKLLLGKRKNIYGHGTWALPGGRIEFMERARDAIVREVKEELGIGLTRDGATLLAVTDDPSASEKTHHLHMTFGVNIGTRRPKLMEPQACEGWDWFPLKFLPEPLFAPHAKILRTIESGQIYI